MGWGVSLWLYILLMSLSPSQIPGSNCGAFVNIRAVINSSAKLNYLNERWPSLWHKPKLFSGIQVMGVFWSYSACFSLNLNQKALPTCPVESAVSAVRERGIYFLPPSIFLFVAALNLSTWMMTLFKSFLLPGWNVCSLWIEQAYY